MQPSFITTTTTPTSFISKWNPTPLSLQTHKPTNSLSFKALSLSVNPHQPKPNDTIIPLVIIKKNGKVYKYSVEKDELVCLNGEDPPLFQHGFDKRLVNFFKCGLRDFFIPKEVSESYVDYVKWKLLHRVFGSALQVLATQAMFRAIGVGYARSLPSAAALNWVLKDGLGRLSRCIYTACVGRAFDTNLKRIRFTTAILFSLSIGVELMTPAFPHCFLLLATVANISKQISLACYLATGTAVHRSFAIADNLGEVSAKGQIQTVCFDNLGLLLAALLNFICKNNQRLQAGLPFVVYPIFSAIDLYGIYQSLKHVHLQTLTKDKLEIILDTWIQFGHVPSPAEVSKLEGISLLDCGKKKGEWPIRIGCLDPKRQMPLLMMSTMKSLSSEDFYFICVEICSGLNKCRERGILVSFREGAGTSDIIIGLLQACYIRKALLSSKVKWKNMLEACEVSDTFTTEWFRLIASSKKLAEGEYNAVHEQMSRLGWVTNNVLLGNTEQVRYSFMGQKIL